MTRRDEPMPLRDAIAAVTQRLGLPAPDAVATLDARWDEIAGPAVAQHARVRSVRDGVCTIAVDGPGWATRLRYGASDLVERANACCGAGTVTAIRVVVEGPRKTR
jgi:predicted nucleic acid-binding Zn ribbon protein